MACIVIHLPDPHMNALRYPARQKSSASKVGEVRTLHHELQRCGLAAGMGTGKQSREEPAHSSESGGAA